jgi:ADP-heptose:LPS heptosyltransferase
MDRKKQSGMRFPKRILLSRCDSIGDVVLTLPMAGVIKSHSPSTEILFLGKDYTRPVIEACVHIDGFVDIRSIEDNPSALKALNLDSVIHVFPKKEIAALCRKAGIPQRIGTTGRLYHWFSCNRLVPMSRKRSPLHEAQLNLGLLSGIGIKQAFSKEEIPAYYGFSRFAPLPGALQALIDPDRVNVILHPLSFGSARNWGPDNYASLAGLLPTERFKVFVSGTQREGELIRSSGLLDMPQVTDLTGKLDLTTFISFIAASDAVVAASTGPLHLAAAMGKHAIGIYPPIRPMHPVRWAPLGKHAEYLVLNKECSDCRNGGACACMNAIRPEEVLARLLHDKPNPS